MTRFANQGFQKGWFGFAVDLGAYQRFWGIGSTGFSGQAVLGGPFGLQLAALGMVGTNSNIGIVEVTSSPPLRKRCDAS